MIAYAEEYAEQMEREPSASEMAERAQAEAARTGQARPHAGRGARLELFMEPEAAPSRPSMTPPRRTNPPRMPSPKSRPPRKLIVIEEVIEPAAEPESNEAGS